MDLVEIAGYGLLVFAGCWFLWFGSAIALEAIERLRIARDDSRELPGTGAAANDADNPERGRRDGSTAARSRIVRGLLMLVAGLVLAIPGLVVIVGAIAWFVLALLA